MSETYIFIMRPKLTMKFLKMLLQNNKLVICDLMFDYSL